MKNVSAIIPDIDLGEIDTFEGLLLHGCDQVLLKVDGVDESEVRKHSCLHRGELIPGQVDGTHSRDSFETASPQRCK